MLGLKQNASCRRTFVNFGILFLPFVYILDILLYVKQTGTLLLDIKTRSWFQITVCIYLRKAFTTWAYACMPDRIKNLTARVFKIEDGSIKNGTCTCVLVGRRKVEHYDNMM